MKQNYTPRSTHHGQHTNFKLLLVVVILMCGITNLFGQTLPICGFNQTSSNSTSYSGNYDPDYLDNFEDITFGIYFWGIKTSTEQKSVTPARIDSVMKELNKAFKPFNVCFVLRGFSYIEGNDDLFQNGTPGEILNYASNHNFVKENSINCFLPYTFGGWAANASGTQIGGSVLIRTHYAHYGDTTLPKIVAHEMGHLFSLRHCHGILNQGNGVVEEHVTRDASAPNYNALSAGDDVHDTPAIPDFWDPAFGYWEGPNHSMTILDTTNCTFDSADYNFVDEEGTPLQITTYDVQNYMTYAALRCKDHFTPGQGIRMREYIAQNSTIISPWLLNDATTDLYVQDFSGDYGEEPDTMTNRLWESPAIWVRHQQDGGLTGQNPQYMPDIPNYIYVRVHNRGCDTTSANAQLRLFWTKASVSLAWPYNWVGNHFPNNGPLMGDVVGTISIPPVAPGESVVLSMPWLVPNPSDYAPINSNPWHFCLLAKVISSNDQITPLPAGSTSLVDFVAMNNNVAWKNLTVVNLDPNTLGKPIGGAIAVGNPLNHQEMFNLKFSTGITDSGTSLFKEAEIGVTVDDVIWQAWLRGGQKSHNLRAEDHKFILIEPEAMLENLIFAPKEVGVANVEFNFLTEKVTNQDRFVFTVVQELSASNTVFGGETYVVNKSPRPLFFAQVQGDLKVDKGENLVLNAQSINEPALYNWYDSLGNLVYQGADFSTSIQIGEKYKLEVIALSDGFKDYKTVKLSYKPNRIETISPNPTAGQIFVTYQINEGNNAYLAIVPVAGGAVSNNYILNLQEHSTPLDLQLLPRGAYIVTLIVDGTIEDTKTIVKQ